MLHRPIPPLTGMTLTSKPLSAAEVFGLININAERGTQGSPSFPSD